jgi:hypothetical protein
MKICGFTFVRNAVKYDYPIVESILSILPIVDEFIVSVGNCDDGTLELIQSIASPKIRIFHSVWDDSLKEGGYVLAAETDKALAHVPKEYDWAFYLQADELVHEKYFDSIIAAAKRYKDDWQVEGLLFKYVHFYGSYDYTGDSRRWYSHEIRLIRNNGNIVSYKDAQGFRTTQNKKLKVKAIDASKPSTLRSIIMDGCAIRINNMKRSSTSPVSGTVRTMRRPRIARQTSSILQMTRTLWHFSKEPTRP